MLWGMSYANYAIGEEETEGNDEMGDDSDNLFLLALHDTREVETTFSNTMSDTEFVLSHDQCDPAQIAR